MKYKNLIDAAARAREKALTFKTKVGAAIQTKDGKIYAGFNIENRIHKGHHAEEVALIRALFEGYKGSDFEAMAIVYETSSEENPYPACASCRQYMWENTSPDLIVIAAQPDGTVLYKGRLKKLYPYPYPSKPKYA